MKRTLAATLLILTTCAAASAQEARRLASADASTRARAVATRPPRSKSVAADGPSPKPDANVDAVDKLIERNELAEGGVAKARIKSRIMRGSVEISISGVPGSFESYEKAPDKKLEVLNAPAGQFIQGVDGGSRWTKSPWSLADTLPAGEGESGEAGARRAGWRKYFTSASVRGRAVVDGREMVVLAATPKGEKPVVMYFDAETWLLRKQEFAARDTKDDNPLKAIYFDSYAEVDGVKVPTVYRQVYEMFTLTFRIYEVKDNVPIDDALFRNPNVQ